MNSGKCIGGPYHGKPIHHPLPEYRVAFTANTKRGITTYSQSPTLKVPSDLNIGTYRYRGETQDWLWWPPKEA